MGGDDSEQVSLLESPLMMRARFDPGNKVIIVIARHLKCCGVGGSSGVAVAAQVRSFVRRVADHHKPMHSN